MTRDPFMSLRTRPLPVREQAPRRRCRQCGAVLSAGNSGDLCAPCEGVRLPDDIPEWVFALADADGMAMGILGRVLTGVGVRSQLVARNAAIRREYREGATKEALEATYRLSRHHLNRILYSHGGR